MIARVTTIATKSSYHRKLATEKSFEKEVTVLNKPNLSNKNEQLAIGRLLAFNKQPKSNIEEYNV